MTKVLIQMYDPTVKEPPYTFITLKETEANLDFPKDKSGEKKYQVLYALAEQHGYKMRFYSYDGEEIHLIVQNPNPNIIKCTCCGCDINGEDHILCDDCKHQIDIMAKIWAGKTI